MKRLSNIYLIALVLYGCVAEDFFGLSSYGEIKNIEVSNQASQAVIDKVNNFVTLEMPAGIDLSQITVQQLTLSSFATSDVKVGDVINLEDIVYINVMAEDQTVTRWQLVAAVATSNPQLPNSDFNAWYQTSGGYYEPGENEATTIWGTGNAGTQLLGLFPTTPLEIKQDNLAVSMETLYNGRVAETFGAPISAGSVFTGKFNLDDFDFSNPMAAIDFGTNFTGRPDGFRINYAYQPGAENKDKDGNILDYPDACDIYILLEVRSGNSSRRLATAWFRSEDTVEDLTMLEVDFTYGELPSDAPDYMKPPDGQYVSADSATFILPTHLTFVATSSYDGNSFAGAVGSVLVLDDLEMIYE